MYTSLALFDLFSSYISHRCLLILKDYMPTYGKEKVNVTCLKLHQHVQVEESSKTAIIR